MRIQKTAGDRMFDFVNLTIIGLWSLVTLYPLYYIVIGSISSINAMQDAWIWPSEFSLDGYRQIFDMSNIWTGYRNSLIYMILGTFINLLFTLPAAYALSRKDMQGRTAIMIIITFTMFFSGGLIPTYLTVKNLGILDSVWAMVLPNAVAVWNLIIARTFFQSTIPDELLEAAKMDGCSDAKFFFKIALPLSPALITIIGLFYGVAHWNAYFNALVYLRNSELFPLQLVLRSILIQNDLQNNLMADPSVIMEKIKQGELIKYGVILVSSLPLLVLYPFLQRYFIKGVMIGSIKG
jgi:putative aldouronate transport system permease protein